MHRTRSSWQLAAAALVVVGAVLTMHGLSTGATPDVVHSEDAGHHGDDVEHCPDCGPGHVLATCLAVLALVAGILARRVRPSAGAPTSKTTVPGRTVARAAPLRPPGWRELSVMRC